MALPCRTTGSLYPTFVPARPVGLTVKHAYAIALHIRLPTVLSIPLKASDTLSEATTPVKLPTTQCLPLGGIRNQENKGWYFTVGSPKPSGPGSTPPTYPTHHSPNANVKL
jgi:hypothetical protein